MDKKGRKQFQARGNPYTKKQWCDENIRRCLVNVQEFRMYLDTAGEVEGIESRIIRGFE